MPNSNKIQCQDKWIYELKVDPLCPYLLLPMAYRTRSRSPPRPSSSVEWRSGMWNDRLSELCMRAVEEANITFDANKDKVLTELYERITMILNHTSLYRRRSRSPPRPSSAPTFVYSGAMMLACDVNHTSLGRHNENSPPQGKLVELIGRSSVEWRGGVWNDRLSELCMRAVEEANITFDADNDRVLTELYERITTFRTRNEVRTRTKEEIVAIVAFWCKLQAYRRQYLKRNGRVDTVDEVLSETDIMRVKRDWEEYEMYYDLSDYQREYGHLPSIYNAALHNRSGWSTVANAIIKYQLPQLPHTRASDGGTEHIQSINRFCTELLQWLKTFTSETFDVRPAAWN